MRASWGFSSFRPCVLSLRMGYENTGLRGGGLREHALRNVQQGFHRSGFRQSTDTGASHMNPQQVATQLSPREFIQLCTIVDAHYALGNDLIEEKVERVGRQVRFDVISVERDEENIVVIVNTHGDNRKKVRMKSKYAPASTAPGEAMTA